MDADEPPVFGPNGAVLNNPQMEDRLRADYLGAPLPAEPAPRTRGDRFSHAVFPLLYGVAWWMGTWWWTPSPQWQPVSAAFLAVTAAYFVRCVWPVGRREGAAWLAAYAGVVGVTGWIHFFG